MAERYVSTFYPGVLESGGGYGFFYIMEGYWAFGFVGVFLTMGIYGGLLNVFYRWCRVNMNCDAMAILYGIAIYPLAMYAVRSGLIISIKTMLMDVLPIAVVMCLPGLAKRIKPSGENS
jgi:oligosaccharide repeat unit polymerase